MSNSELDGLFSDYTVDAARTDAAAADRGSDGVRLVQFSKLDPGLYNFRFLPMKPHHKSPFALRYTHFIKTPEGTRAMLCPRLMGTGECATCVEVAALLATGQAADSAVADDMDAVFTVQALALDLDIGFDPALPLGQLCKVEYKTTVHEQLTGLRTAARGGVDFTHPLLGNALGITKTGSGKASKYTVGGSMVQGKGPMIQGVPEDVATKAMVAILKGAPDIFLYEFRSPDDVAKLLAEAGFGGGVPPVQPRGAGAGAFLGQNFGRTPG